MQKFRFQYQFEGKGLENNFGSSVKLSDYKKKSKWPPKSKMAANFHLFVALAALPLRTFVLLNTNRDFGLYT